MGAAAEDLLSDDLICNIVSRLPVPSLIRARCVCKRWQALVTSKEFLHQAKNSAAQQRWPWCLLSCAVTQEGSDKLVDSWAFDPQFCRWYKMSFPGLKPVTEMTLLRSGSGASGLVVFRGQVAQDQGQGPCYWVGNPVTNRWQCIALSEGASPHGGGYDDKIVHQLLVDESGNSYKIVRICQGTSCFEWQVEIYDSTTREWRKGAKITFDNFMLLPSSSTSFNGLVYCLGLDCSPGGFANKKVVILAYDVVDDVFRIAISSSTVLPCVSQLQLNWFTLQVTVVSNEQQHWIELVGRTDLPKSTDEPHSSSMPQTERIFIIRYDAQNCMWVGESDMKVSDGFDQEYCGYLNCSAGGRLLYLTSSTSPFQGVVMYDRSELRSWSSLPHHIRKSEDVLQSLFGASASMGSFIPRLDIVLTMPQS